MSACDPQTFNNVTSTAWDCLVQKAESSGLPIIVGHKGEASKDGFTVTWNYNPEAESLVIQCIDSPWWAPCSVIDSKINELVGGCL